MKQRHRLPHCALMEDATLELEQGMGERRAA
ncbi:hypothetical protein SCE1572_23170 [Sorangium cellulosum So0157-2]|uniref:Uncharacterized protein n=1 Tax=Sorangium cellulosum So0157-2 TaxID=1254432 RepID=S4XV73_SORCE|nr:hypothetical protein SCE1572_23170 [Sorangium cellulosum So0157-2]